MHSQIDRTFSRDIVSDSNDTPGLSWLLGILWDDKNVAQAYVVKPAVLDDQLLAQTVKNLFDS